MKTRIDILDVGLGLATITHLPSRDGEALIGLVDVFKGQRAKHYPLLDILRDLRERYRDRFLIKFLVLTHLHRDHIGGLASLLREFGTDIQLICDPGLNPRAVGAAVYRTKDPVDSEVRKDLNSLAEFKDRWPERVRCLAGPGVVIYEDASRNVRVQSIAPLGTMLSSVQQALERYISRASHALRTRREIPKPPTSVSDLNRTSSAIELQIGDERVVIGGDVYRSAWEKLLRGRQVTASAFVLSHHGAANGFPEKSWKRSIHRDGMAAIVSCAGPHHPSESVVEELKRLGTPVIATRVEPRWKQRKQRKQKPSSDLTQFAGEAHYASRTPEFDTKKRGTVVVSVAEAGVSVEGPVLAN